MTVTNEGSTGNTNLGFAGNVACRIEVETRWMGTQLSVRTSGYYASVTCSTMAEPPLG